MCTSTRQNSIRRPGGEKGKIAPREARRTGHAAAGRRRAARAPGRRDGGSRLAQAAANSTDHTAQPCKSALRCPRSAEQLRNAPAVMSTRDAHSCGRGRLPATTRRKARNNSASIAATAATAAPLVASPGAAVLAVFISCTVLPPFAPPQRCKRSQLEADVGDEHRRRAAEAKCTMTSPTDTAQTSAPVTATAALAMAVEMRRCCHRSRHCGGPPAVAAANTAAAAAVLSVPVIAASAMAFGGRHACPEACALRDHRRLAPSAAQPRGSH